LSWDASAIESALASLGIPLEATLLLHSNLSLFSKPREGTIDRAILQGLTRHTTRTVVLPGFTYSLGRNEVFDPRDVPKEMGVLSVLAHTAGWQRSLDPMFSMYSNGPQTTHLFSKIPPRSFGPDSVFDRLIQSDSWLLSINLDAGSTLAHQIEYEFGVPHRFIKVFNGTVRFRGLETPVVWESYVRNLSQLNSRQNFKRLTENLHNTGLLRTVKLGGGRLAAIRISDYRKHILSKLHECSGYLTAAMS